MFRIPPVRPTAATRLLAVTLLAALIPSQGAGQVPSTGEQSCELPEALKNIASHALLRYTVDSQGRAKFIKPAFVVVDPPASEVALVTALRECLKKRSYPGVTWRSSVEMLQAFHYFRPAPPGSETVSLGKDRRFPKVHLEELARLRLELAAQLLAGPRYQEAREPGWVLRTDVHSYDQKQAVEAIDRAVQAFDEAFPGRPPLDDDHAMTIFLFSREDDFNQVAAFDRILRGPQPAGQYMPADATAYAFVSKREKPLRLSLDVLVHEVAHHLVHQRLAGPGREVPFWVDEGIASLLELLREPRDGRIDLVDFERGRQVQSGHLWIAAATRYLDALEEMDKEGRWPELAAFLGGDPAGLQVEEAYALSWALVHYLLHGEEGALRDPFRRWLAGEMGTADDPGVLTATNLTAMQLDVGLRDYVASLRRF